MYIKYDKNLIVKTDKLEYFNKKTNKKLIFKIQTSINYKNEQLFVNLDNIEFDNINLKLKGKLAISKENIEQLSNKNLKNIILNDFEFVFDEKLKPIKAKKIFINKKNNNIKFTFLNPTYDGIKIDGTIIKLNNINKAMSINIDLSTKSLFNKKIKDILSYYKVDLPIEQNSGINNTNAKININLKNKQTNIIVNSTILNSEVIYDKKIINSKSLIVRYENKIVNTILKSANIKYNEYNIMFDNANLVLKDNILDIKLQNGNARYDKYNAKYDEINLNIKNNIVNIDINNTKIKNHSIGIKNTNIVIDQNYTKINIKTNISNKKYNLDLNANYNLDNNTSTGNININNLYYEDLISIKNKNFDFEYEKFKDIENIRINKYSLFYTKYGKHKHILQVNRFSPILKQVKFLNAISNHSNIRFQSNDDFKTSQIYLSNTDLNVDAKKFDLFNNQKSKYKYMPKIDINIHNSKLAYDQRYIYIKDATVDIIDNKIDMRIIPIGENTVLNIHKVGKHIKADAKNISAKFINRVMKKSKLKDGNIDIVINSTPRDVNGEIIFHKITIKNVRVLNNLIAFINTTPAYFNPILALPTVFHLGETNFSTNGYLIKKGNCNFTYNRKNKLLKVSSLYTKGVMADFKGNITANFLTNKISSQMKVIFLKDYSRVIKNIPILGYVIVGKEGNFETQVDIDGSFEKQTFTTHILNNTSKGILNVIKRTISIPLLPFLKKEDMP